MSGEISESWVEAATSDSDVGADTSPPVLSHGFRQERRRSPEVEYYPPVSSTFPADTQRLSRLDARASLSQSEQYGSPPEGKNDIRRTTPARRPPLPYSTDSEELVMPTLDQDTLRASNANYSRQQQIPRKRSTRKREVQPEQRSTNRTISHPPNPSSKSDIIEAIFDHIGTMLGHILDIISRSLRLLKTPLAIAFAAFLLLQIGLTTRNFIVSSIYSSVSPICIIPGVSLLNLPFCPGSSRAAPEGKAEFDQLMNVQSKFEDVLRETAIGITLPVDMKRSEASIRDLRQLVRYSHLGSRQELGLEFDGFIETAKQASFDLQKFNSHIGRAVDQVLSTTRWTIRVLDDISVREFHRGALSIFQNKLLSPFKSPKFTEVALLDQYIKHATSIEEQLHALINEAMLLLMVLNNLDDRLEIIHGIVTRENTQISATRSEVLSELWTLVGGNRKSLNKMTSQLDLLSQVNTYRSTAYAHVSGTILKLQEISSGIEDLRERVGTPANMRDRTDVPLEVHLESIKLGVERLEGSREMERKNEVGNMRTRVGVGEPKMGIDA